MEEKENLEIREQIDQLYNEITNSTDSKTKIQLLYSIIEIKQNYTGLANYGNELYVDIKKFVHISLTNPQKCMYNYGYDKNNYDKILNITKMIPVDKQIEVFMLCKRTLKQEYEDCTIIENELWRAKRKLLKKKNLYLFILYLSSENIRNMVITFLLFWVSLSLMSIDAPYSWMGVLYFSKLRYVNYDFINNFANVIVWMFDLDNNARIAPTNLWGLLVIVIIKLLYFLIMVNIIYKRFLLKTNIYEN